MTYSLQDNRYSIVHGIAIELAFPSCLTKTNPLVCLVVRSQVLSASFYRTLIRQTKGKTLAWRWCHFTSTCHEGLMYIHIKVILTIQMRHLYRSPLSICFSSSLIRAFRASIVVAVDSSSVTLTEEERGLVQYDIWQKPTLVKLRDCMPAH